MRITSRIFAVIVVLTALAVVPVSFGGSPYAETPYDTAEDIVAKSDTTVGTEVLLYGQVVGTDPVIIKIELDDSNHVRFKIYNVKQQVRIGAYLEVYGLLVDDRTVKSKGTVVRGEREHWYTYTVSFFAGLVVLARVVRVWTIDPSTYTLIPREDDA